MVRVGIVGLNSLSYRLSKIINYDKCYLVSFFTDNDEYLDRRINNKPIRSINKIESYKLNLIINTSNIEIRGENVLNFNWYIKNFYDYQIYKVFDKIFSIKENINGCITGLSHFQVGIDETKFDEKTINLAVTSQDIFYDFEMIKYIYSQSDNLESLRFVIIGLSYYSFEYDLAKTINRYRQHSYYSFVNKYKDSNNEALYSMFDKFYDTAKDTFVEDFRIETYKVLKAIDEKGWNEFISGELDDNKLKMGEEFVNQDSRKNYPETVKENIDILNKYIDFLRDKNVEPIIVISPHTKYYSENLSSDLKERFEEIVNEIKKNRNIKVLNYFYSDEFTNNDFYDVVHLNRRGAEKFSLILNNIVNNLNI
jgi:hypothetical protein